MSLLVFAGGAQFTVVRLVAQGAPRSLLVIAATLINLRHVLYGLSLAPHPPGGPTRPPRGRRVLHR